MELVGGNIKIIAISENYIMYVSVHFVPGGQSTQPEINLKQINIIGDLTVN
jgi:hypothetical protein